MSDKFFTCEDFAGRVTTYPLPLSAEERDELGVVEQLCANTAYLYYHLEICAKIAARIDCSKDSLAAILEDSYARQKFNMKARQL